MREKEQLLTHELLTLLMDYDPDQGLLIWKIRTEPMIKETARWNTRYAGKAAGTKNKDGYIYVIININGKQYMFTAHRLIWFFVYREWPENIDHINRNRSDNRLVNLRSCSGMQNMHNSGPRKNSKSGIKGVTWSKVSKKWRASIGMDGKTKTLGEFENINDAKLAYIRASIARHGEFSLYVN